MNSQDGEIKLHFLDYWRVIRVRLPLIILVFMLVVITAGVITYYMPREYQARTTVQVRSEEQDMQVFGNMRAQMTDPRFLGTQFQIIQSTAVLYPVIETLDLVNRWAEFGVRSRQQAYSLLRSRLEVTDIRNTDLLQILAWSRDPVEAAELANTVSAEYEKQRNAVERGRTKAALTQLDDEITKQRQNVEALKETATKLRQELGIIDLNPEGVAESLAPETSIVMDVVRRASDARIQTAVLQSRYEQISGMTDEQIIRSLSALEISDTTIPQIFPIYQETKSEEARMLNSGLGPNHPDVKSLRAKRQEYERQLGEQITSLRKTLKTNLEISQRSLKEIEDKLAETRGVQEQEKTQSSRYVDAKNTYIQAKRILEAAETKLYTERLDQAMPKVPVAIIDKAEPPEGPSRPKVVLNMLLSVVVGLVFGVGLAFFIEYLDTSVKTMEDVESMLGVPVLAVIRKNVARLLEERNDHPDAEAYRIMRTNVEFNRKSPNANTFTFVSGGVGEGKSTTLSNLAYTFAQGGYTTLVIDADLRRPTQHKVFDFPNEEGLTDFLTTDIPVDQIIKQTKVPNLYFIPSGKLPLDAVSVLNSQRMVDLVSDVKSRFDVVFFDAPPILGVSDASVLASAVDLTIIVVQHRRFPRAMLQRVKSSVENVGGTILGVVLNNVDVRHDQYYEYYTSYYNYYTPRQKDADKKARKEKRRSQRESDGGAGDNERKEDY